MINKNNNQSVSGQLTVDYYNKNYYAFVESTQNVDFSDIQNMFIDLLPKEADILDFGCGSGRDAKYFLEHGYHVEAIDGSTELCRLASIYTGIEVRHMLFQELNEREKYDGIWACASILHLNKAELSGVFEKMSRALKKNGIIYTSFKYGDFEGMRNGRYFTDFTIETFSDFIKEVPEIYIEEKWISTDVRPGRNKEKWLNLILRKKDS